MQQRRNPSQSVDPAIMAEWRKKYPPEVIQKFLVPAEICQRCGKPMSHDPSKGTPYSMNERERRFSVHDECRMAAFDMLDRKLGMSSRRG